jgi:hypothetical protein
MSIADTGRLWEILVIPILQILEDSGKYWLYQYCRYWKILENTGYISIADSGRFWKILVIPVLQILEDSGKYWKILENTGYTSIADTGRLATKLRNVLVYCFFLSCLCVCYERTDSV